MNALILAGKQADGPLRDLGVSKAMIKINGKEMILYVLEALKAVEYIDRIAVVGDAKDLAFLKNKVDVIVEQEYSMAENIVKGAQEFPEDEELLVLTCDIPMITPEAIKDFVQKARATGADFNYPIVRREDNDTRYPGVHRTYVRIRDGTFTGGNIVLVRAGIVKKAMERAKYFLAYRKKPWMLAKILGVSFVVKLLLGMLTIKELENRVSDLFGIKAKAVISAYPEIGTDVDKKSDLELAQKVLAGGI
ncbi:MAG: nucleotidyltransferase family protein [Tepidanaerobacteraceae bacterium]|jgi:molybdopterin-guanine dinucleotide biosynthesis protein A|nr:nucleotidyltransferase family protein [Tepidanaerobacteraceae bacterium]